MPRNKPKNKAKSGGGGGPAAPPAPDKPNVVAKEEKVETPVVAVCAKPPEPTQSVEKVEPVVADKSKEVKDKIEEPSKQVEIPKPIEATKTDENCEGDSQTLKKKRNRNKKNKNQQQQGEDVSTEADKPGPPLVAAPVENKTNQQTPKKPNKGKQQTQPAKPIEKITVTPAAVSEESSTEKSTEPPNTGTAKRRNRNRRNKNKSNTDEKEVDDCEDNKIEAVAEKPAETPKENVEIVKEVSVEATVQVEGEQATSETPTNNKGGGKQDNKQSKQDKKQQGKQDNNKKTNVSTQPSKSSEVVNKVEEAKQDENKQGKKQQGKQDKKTNSSVEPSKPEPKQPEVKPDEVKLDEVKPTEPVKIEESKPSQQNDNKQSPKSNKKNNAKSNKQDPQEKVANANQGNIKFESKTESSSEQVAENASEIVSEPKIAKKPEPQAAQAKPTTNKVHSNIKLESKSESSSEQLAENASEIVSEPKVAVKSETEATQDKPANTNQGNIKCESKTVLSSSEEQVAENASEIVSEPKIGMKPETEVAQIKPEEKVELIKPDAKPESQAKPEITSVIQSVVISEPQTKPEPKSEYTPATAPEIKSDLKSNTEMEAKPEAKPEVASQQKQEEKIEILPVVKPEPALEASSEIKSEVKVEDKSKVIPETKPEVSSQTKLEENSEVKPEIKPEVKPATPKPIPTAVAAVTPSQPILKPQPSAEQKPVEVKKEDSAQDHQGGKGKNKQQQKKQDKKAKTPEPKPTVKPEVKTHPVPVDQPAVLELSTPPLELKLSEPKPQQKPEIKPKPLFNKPEERKLNIQAIPDPIANLKKTPSPVPFISPTREFEVKLVPEIPIQDKIELKVDTSLPVSPHLSKKEAEKQLISEALSELIDAASVPEPIKIDNLKTISDKNRIETQSQPNEDTKSTTSKNEGGSDFVLSANAVTGDDTTKSLKSVSPTENKRTKDELNAKQSESGDEKQLHDLPEKTPQEKIEGVKFASKLLEILDAVMVASPEQKQALRSASEKLSEDGDTSKNTDKQQKVDNKNKTGAKPKNQQTATSPTTTGKPEIPPKPEHLVSKNKNQKPQQQSGGGNNSKKKPDLLPKPGKDKIPPVSQKQQQSSNSKNLQTVPTPNSPQTSESWNDETKTNQSNPKNLFSAPTQSPPNQPATDKGWSTKQNKKQKKLSPESRNVTSPSSGATSTPSPSKIQIPPELQNKKIPNIAEMLEIISKARGDLTTADTLPLSSKTLNPKELMDDGIDDDEDEEYYEYKFIPRQVFLASNCFVCQLPLQKISPCKKCQMIVYCSDKHEKQDANNHKPLCQALYEIAEKRGGHVFHNAKVLTDDEYRSLRVHTMNLCQSALQRPLQPYEREIILFPRLCAKSTCRESNPELITNCKNCNQAAYCIAHEDHLNPETHQKWCKYYDLYKKIVVEQKKNGKIEPTMPTKMAVKPYILPKSINHVFCDLYKNFNDLKNDCGYSILTQLATAPLTALYCAQSCDQPIGDVYTIHLVGAEIQFEADMLDKWEAFFLHLVPNLVELKIVFIGPELNSENLPLDILSRIRMCRACRQSCRAVRFDFQCGKLYHSYCRTSCFTKPDLICFFNPGLHRPTGFRELDTWPETIVAATEQNCPIIVTSYTELESPKDYERLVTESKRKLNVIQTPEINPYSSYRPERNFISDEIAPMIFKNYFYFIVK